MGDCDKWLTQVNTDHFYHHYYCFENLPIAMSYLKVTKNISTILQTEPQHRGTSGTAFFRTKVAIIQMRFLLYLIEAHFLTNCHWFCDWNLQLVMLHWQTLILLWLYYPTWTLIKAGLFKILRDCTTTPILLNHLWQEAVKYCVSFKYVILARKTLLCHINYTSQETKSQVRQFAQIKQ